MGTTIVTGFYGSGKTEFCVNFSVWLQKKLNRDIFLADMDVVNPYFRSREKVTVLAKSGVYIIGNNLGNTTGQDIPAISGEMMRAVLANDELVVDLAGSSAGLKALSLFKENLNKYELLCVLNAYREETSTVRKMTDCIKNAEAVSGLRVTGIVHNSHLVHDTTPEDVLQGQALVVKAAAELGLAIKYTLIKESVYSEIKSEIKSETVISFERLMMRESWQ